MLSKETQVAFEAIYIQRLASFQRHELTSAVDSWLLRWDCLW